MSGRNMSADEALYDAKDDMKTHRAAWRNALVVARDSQPPAAQEGSDRAYWEHELRAFDRTFEVLCREFG